MTILLCISNGDTQVTGFYGLRFIYHRRTLHSIVGSIGKEFPVFAIERGFHLILIEESGIFELCPHLAELLDFTQVNL